MIQEQPSRDAAAALQRKLDRMQKDHADRGWIREAFIACRDAAPLDPKTASWARHLVRQARQSASK